MLTQVYGRSAHTREVLAKVIRENLDLGHPDRVQLNFERPITRHVRQ